MRDYAQQKRDRETPDRRHGIAPRGGAATSLCCRPCGVGTVVRNKWQTAGQQSAGHGKRS